MLQTCIRHLSAPHFHCFHAQCNDSLIILFLSPRHLSHSEVNDLLGSVAKLGMKNHPPSFVWVGWTEMSSDSWWKKSSRLALQVRKNADQLYLLPIFVGQ